jgi:hypothetical protein
VDALSAGQGATIVAPFRPAPLIELPRSERFKATIEDRAILRRRCVGRADGGARDFYAHFSDSLDPGGSAGLGGRADF